MKLAIIDFNRTIYDPETDLLVSGATSALDRFKQKGFTLVLISRKEPGRDVKVSELGLADYFSETIFVDEKTPELFTDILKKYDARPPETYVLGDHAQSEISVGCAIGAKTIYFRSGKFKDLVPHKGLEPTHTITHLQQITELL